MYKKRLKEIVEILLKQESYITINNISKQLHVSNKTIRNDLKILEQWLLENKLTLIKKTGVGIYINGDQVSKLNILDTITSKNKELIDYSPEARKIFIAMRLLTSQEVCKIYEIAKELHVSRATIHMDLKKVTVLFKEYKLMLHHSTNQGLQIKGLERHKRNLLFDLMLQDKGYPMFRNIVNNDNYLCDGSILFAGADMNDDEVNEFVRILKKHNHLYLNELLFDHLVFLLLRIFVSYLRVIQGCDVELSNEFINDLSKQPFFNESKDICDILSDYYAITLNTNEIYYLQVYWISLQDRTPISEVNNIEIKKLATLLIASWSTQLQLPLTKDQELFDSLCQHLFPAITRFRYNIRIENPLMQEITNQYKNTYKIVKHSTLSINEQYSFHICDEEIGYLTLYLATAIDKYKKPLKTILVCESGIGIHNLLIHKLTSHFNEIHITSQESFSSIYTCSLEDVDLILSTIDLRQTSIPVIKIRPLLKDFDLIQLRKIICKYYKAKNDPQLYLNRLKV